MSPAMRRYSTTRARNEIFRNSFFSEPFFFFFFLHFMKVQSFLYVPVHEISWPCDVSKVVKHSIENWTSCFQLLTSANWKVAVQTALYSLCLAPIELHIEVSVSLLKPIEGTPEECKTCSEDKFWCNSEATCFPCKQSRQG